MFWACWQAYYQHKFPRIFFLYLMESLKCTWIFSFTSDIFLQKHLCDGELDYNIVVCECVSEKCTVACFFVFFL